MIHTYAKEVMMFLVQSACMSSCLSCHVSKSLNIHFLSPSAIKFDIIAQDKEVEIIIINIISMVKFFIQKCSLTKTRFTITAFKKK